MKLPFILFFLNRYQQNHRIELLKDTNRGTNFLFTYADVHWTLKIRLKDARNVREVVRFTNKKDFNYF